MKSEHRHELKTNELANWISNFPQWVNKNLKNIIYVAVLIVVVLGVSVYTRYYKNVIKVNREIEFTKIVGQLPMIKNQVLDAQSKGEDRAHILLPFADTTLKEAALVANNDLSSALTLIKRAEALRSELHYRPNPATEKETTDRLTQAKDLYSQAMELAGPDLLLKANAKFGIGLCLEEMGKIEEAKQTYKDISTDSQFAATVAAVQAKDRLAVIDDYQKPVIFKKPAPQAAMPQVKIEEPLVNMELPVIDSANEPNI